MGNRAWHIARAEHHKKVAEHLRQQADFEDWSLVALYYSALQFVDSILCDIPALPKDERHPRKHSGLVSGQLGRNQLVKAHLKVIETDYRSLEDLSRRTRYDFNKLAAPDADAYDRALPQWAHIEKYARMMHMSRPVIPSDAP